MFRFAKCYLIGSSLPESLAIRTSLIVRTVGINIIIIMKNQALNKENYMCEKCM